MTLNQSHYGTMKNLDALPWEDALKWKESIGKVASKYSSWTLTLCSSYAGKNLKRPLIKRQRMPAKRFSRFSFLLVCGVKDNKKTRSHQRGCIVNCFIFPKEEMLQMVATFVWIMISHFRQFFYRMFDQIILIKSYWWVLRHSTIIGYFSELNNFYG